MRSSSVAAVAPVAVLLTLAGSARGQSTGGFSLDRLDPAPAGDVFFGVPSPSAPGHLAPRLHAMFDTSYRPIRLREPNIAVVSSQSVLRLDASLPLWDRLLLSVDAPLAVAQAGSDPGIAGVTFTKLKAPEMGDVRIGARFRLAGDDAGPIQIGIGSYMFAPTGSAAQYTGDKDVRGAFHANVGGRIGSGAALIWGGTGGVELGGSNSPHLITFGAAAGVLLARDRLQVDGELYGSAPLGGDISLSSTPALTSKAGTNAELLFGVKLRVLGGLTFGAAAGPGLLKAVGTPIFRAVGLLGWAPLPSPPPPPRPAEHARVGDKDNDGIADDIDACPDIKGDPSPDKAKDGCPPPDRDGDTVLDIDDACPGVPGARNADPTINGCPADSDEDGVYDAADACPAVAGVASKDPKKNGCPPDADGDGIVDAADACPAVAGVASPDPKQNGCPDDPDGDGIKGAADACPNDRGSRDPDPKQNGCPKFVRVTTDEIVTSKPVQFRPYGKSRAETVDPISDDLLHEVRDAILQNQDIEIVEVQGHTDDNGDEEFNLHLSQQRADAVLEWLVAAGVPRDKLVAKGYGFERPLGDNRIRTGRQKNRRVQFVIVKRKSRP